MPQSLSNVIIHLVFSTKDRHPFLDPEIIEKTHAYLATIARDNGCDCYRVGGISDHVHLAIRLSRTLTIAALVEALKKNSSKWIKTMATQYEKFSWQRGYGAFSVNPMQLQAVCDYIDNQEHHHRNKSFQDEFRAFLEKYKIEYDERYVWD